MNKGRQQKQVEVDLTEVLMARKMKLDRSRRIIDRILEQRPVRRSPLNPQNKFDRRNPLRGGLEHFSDSQFSLSDQESKIEVPVRALPRKQPSVYEEVMEVAMTDEQVLAERARQFINRLRKQKQYNEGKLLMLRKKEEERREKREKQINRKQQESYSLYKSQRLSMIMDNILQHEERISSRLDNSLIRLKRSSKARVRTENTDRYEDSPSSMGNYSRIDSKTPSELPSIMSLRSRLKHLSQMIDSLQP